MARPRQFDEDDALRRAMTLFWERGYEGVSLADLTAVMGINKPSLYAAFGDKTRLFQRAVALYDTTAGAPAVAALSEAPTAREAVQRLLAINAEAYVAEDTPRGCMIVLAATVGTIENAEVRAFLAASRRDGEAALAERLRRGVADGDLSRLADVATLASFYTAVLQGMSIQARDGADRASLERIATSAMAAWPAV